MSEIEIFEVTGCYVIGSIVVNDEAIKRDASAEWVKKSGVDIQRCNLAESPQQFLNMPITKEFLNTSGIESLPATLFDGEFVMTGRLPTREDIARQAGTPLAQGQGEDSIQPRCCSVPRMP